MPRPRKLLSMQSRKISTEDRITKEQEEKSVILTCSSLRRPPAWLIDDVAKKEWRRVVKALLRIDIIGDLDVEALGGYCNAFSRYTHAVEQLNGQPLVVERETKNGVMSFRNPLIDVELKYGAEMRSFAKLCGLTIDSRLKAAAIKTKDTQDEITKEFGVI